jgi:type IV fimbrial biogenesis protein FimT
MTKSMGLSLLELLIVVLVLSALLGISLPNLSILMQKTQGELTLRKLANAIQFAKSSAITKNSIVTLCRSRDGIECGGEWRNGVLIFTDTNADREINGEDLLLRYITFPNAVGSINFRAFQNKQYLQLTSLGFTRNQNGNFTYCPDSGIATLASQLIINRTARVRFATDTNNDGLKENSRGKPIRC